MKQLRSEWVKFTTLVSNKVLLLVALAGGIGLGSLVSLVIPEDEIRQEAGTDLFGLATAGVGIASLLVGVLGILVVTQEFRFTARATFAAEPHRPRVMGLKAVLVLVLGLVLGALVIVLALAVNGTLLNLRDLGFEWGGDGFGRAVLGGVLVFAVTALAGLGIGAILRNPAFGITLFVIWNIIVEPIVAGVVPRVGRWFPFTAGSLVAQTDPSTADGGPSIWVGFGIYVAFALVLVLIGTVLVTRRDA